MNIEYLKELERITSNSNIEDAAVQLAKMVGGPKEGWGMWADFLRCWFSPSHPKGYYDR